MSFCVRSSAGYWFGPKEQEIEVANNEFEIRIDTWQKKHADAFKCEEAILAQWIAKALPDSAGPEVVEVTYGIKWCGPYLANDYFNTPGWGAKAHATRYDTAAEARVVIKKYGWDIDSSGNPDAKVVRFIRRVKQ